jgi:hypothetical protein
VPQAERALVKPIRFRRFPRLREVPEVLQHLPVFLSWQHRVPSGELKVDPSRKELLDRAYRAREGSLDMGTYVLLLVIVLLTLGVGAGVGSSYAVEHHEKRFGPAVITVAAWLGVAVAMTCGILAFLALRNIGVTPT